MKKLNYFFVGVPTLLSLIGFVYKELWFIAALFMILTGLFQITTAVIWTGSEGSNNIFLRIYWLLTISFFLMWVFTDWYWIIVLPPIIAIYFTVILNYNFKNT
ncbi:hypothetical protein [Flavobacterium litorale]|uniref:SPW repeat-containing protein n=1 Tax=Flavobacterium litorale TaxID=2856519 RepID=A0ABX8V6X4_9FLAO|nr:hypothetical protein [Flavobacterium litorale]QYJ68502.1 hypothetical protein K1I41_01055 [Flavobacterium litorale]